MIKINHFLSFILVLTFGTTFAHQDFMTTKHFGNVTVRIQTGQKFEEINKVITIGKLAEQFSKQLNYTEKIFLDFKHIYTIKIDPDFYISSRNITDHLKTVEDKSDIIRMPKQMLVISQIANSFEAESTLKLLEFAIQNADFIATLQKDISTEKHVINQRFESIDTTKINAILLELPCEPVKMALQSKLERVDSKLKKGLSYYLKDNKYTIFSRKKGQVDQELLTVNTIYELKKIDQNTMVLFDTDSTFYSIKGNNVSKRQLIKSTNLHFEPFTVKFVNENSMMLTIKYYSLDGGGRLVIRNFNYRMHEDELTEL